MKLSPVQRKAAIADKTLVFIGDANWDIYADSDNKLWSIPKPECPSAEMTPFGDRDHVRRLMDAGHFNDIPTDAGLALMRGLHSKIFTPPNQKPWAMLRFVHPSQAGA
tara:strand:- start:865 stop:1188 length:324 start_codon:yes stop_codon:yes gene_type:complete